MPVFFSLRSGGVVSTSRENAINKSKSNMAQQIGLAIIAFEQRRTGNHGPKSVTVVLGEGTLVITLHEAWSPAEKALAKAPAGAAKIKDLHQQLLTGSSDSLRREIKNITGMEVREATTEVKSVTVVQAFTTGNVVLVFQIVGGVSTESWSGDGTASKVGVALPTRPAASRVLRTKTEDDTDGTRTAG